MNDVTSFETTKKLLEAGFPRSEDWGLQYWIVDEPETKQTFKHSIGGSILSNGDYRNIRASSALDILKVMGTSSHIRYDEKSKQWCCDNVMFMIGTHHENPAEAAAEMFLKVNS